MLDFGITLESALKLWNYAQRLKREERRGWKNLVGGRVESVADHSYALALMAWLEAERRGYDVEKTLKLALIHDLEEAITGDLTPRDKKRLGRTRIQRDRRDAVRQLIAVLPGPSRRSFRRLWADLRTSRTKEARLVHEFDKLEMGLQATLYEKKVGRAVMMSFYRSAQRGTKDPLVKEALKSIMS